LWCAVCVVKIIAGLGNPGSQYQWTRHNAGFMVLDRLSEISGVSCQRKSFSGLSGEGFWLSDRLVLLKPQTYMNLSGRSVAETLRFHKTPIADLIVIHDDLDLPFGKVKLKYGGGHGGHNGLRSIISEVGDRSFYRVRIGIGRPQRGDVVDYVLHPFTLNEKRDLPFVLQGAADLLALVITEGPEKAMSLFHSKELLT
jgi:peptidyl-tRNA hydrolase, PTH1 family